LRRYSDIESVGRRYIELLATRAEIGGIDLVSSRGEICTKCGGGPGTLIRVGKLDKPNREGWTEVCVDCREPWSGEPAEIMSRWVSSSPTISSIEERTVRNLDEWRVLRRVFETEARRGTDGHRFAPGRWNFSVRCFLVYAQSAWSSYERVAEWGQLNEPNLAMRELFTVKRIRHCIPRAKSVLEDRARGEGVIR